LYCVGLDGDFEFVCGVWVDVFGVVFLCCLLCVCVVVAYYVDLFFVLVVDGE